MQGLLASLLGVPATILVAGGLGLVVVTAWTHAVRRQGRVPIRWRHLALGLVLLLVGAGMLELELLVIG